MYPPSGLLSNQENDRWPRLTFLVLALLFLILVILTFNNFQVGAYNDDAHYITIARSLMEGKIYSNLNYPESIQAVAAFPIGFPLALMPIIALFPTILWPLKLAALMSTLINGLLVFRFWPRWTGSSAWWGVGVAGAYWLLPLVVEQARMVMSEPLFLTVYLLLVAVVARYQRGSKRWWHWPAVGILSVALIAVRTIGVAIVLGVGLSFFFTAQTYQSRKQFATTGTLLAMGGILLAMLLLNSNTIFPQRYWQEKNMRYFRAMLPGEGIANEATTPAETGTDESDRGLEWRHFGRKLWRHINLDLPETIFPFSSSLARRIDQQLQLSLGQSLTGLGILVLVLIGGHRWVRQIGWHVLWISALAYAGALFFWNWAGPRLLYAIIPHLLYAFGRGLEAIILLVLGWRRKTESKLPAMQLLLLFVGLFLAASAATSLRHTPSIKHVGDLSQRTVWFKQHASAEQIVMSEYPQVDYLYGETQTVPWPQAKTAAALQDFLRTHQVDYLLLAPEIEWDQPQYQPDWSQRLITLTPLVAELETASKIVLSFSDEAEHVRIYQVVQE